jgi:tetratricopeptide (TPR) repeat protein
MTAANSIGRELAGELGFQLLAAWLEHDLAIPEVERGNEHVAVGHLARSLAMFRAISDLPAQARCCTSLSYVHSRLDNLDESLTWAQEALALSLQTANKTIEGISHLALARHYTLRGDYDLGRVSFDRCINLAKESGNLRSLAKRYQIAGESYLTAEQHQLAVEALRAALDVFHKIGDGNAVAECHLSLATSHRETGNYPDAVSSIEVGLQLARAYANNQREGRILIELGQVRAAQGDLPAAHASWSQAAALLHPISHNDEAIALQLIAGSGGVVDN